jgi:hypothetical protein
MSANVGPKLKQPIAPEAMIVSGGANMDKNYPVRPQLTKNGANSFEKFLQNAGKSHSDNVDSPKNSQTPLREAKAETQQPARPQKTERTEAGQNAGNTRPPVERKDVADSSKGQSRSPKSDPKSEGESNRLPTVRSSAPNRQTSDGTAIASNPESETSTTEIIDPKISKAVSANATEVSEAELEQLKNIFLKNGAPTTKAPVLALLNGNIELLEPGQIPELVSSNPFLSEAFSQLELGSFINQSTELGEIIRDIDPSREVLEEIGRTGIDLTQLTTPRQFFDAIGLDTKRISIELKQLKSSLQMSDGLASYMIRAAKIRSQLGINPSSETDPVVRRADQEVFESSAGASSIVSPEAKMPAGRDKILSTNQPPVPSQKPQVIANQSGSAVMAQSNDEPSRKMAVSDDLNLTTTSESVIQLTSDRPVKEQSIAQPDYAQTQTVDPSSPELQMAATTQTLSLKPVAENLQVERILPQDAAPIARPVSSDPFEALNVYQADANLAKMDTDAAIELEAVEPLIQDEIIPEEKIAEFREAPQLIERTNTQPDWSKQPISGMEKFANIISPETLNLNERPTIEIGEDAEVIEQTPSSSAELVMQVGSSFETNQQNTKPTSERVADRPIEISQLIEQMSRDAMISDRSSGRDGGSRHGGSDSESGRRESIPLQRAEQVGTSAVFDLKQEFEKADIAQVNTEQIAKKVIEKAEIMLRDGGGSVKLEIETKDFGKVDVALKMDGDRLELKLLTTSEGARELVSQNLSKLKEQLSLQNFQLDRVDVGLSMNMNQRGDGSQFMSSEQRHAQQSFAGSGLFGDHSKVIQLPLRARYQPNPYHNGKIQIAV